MKTWRELGQSEHGPLIGKFRSDCGARVTPSFLYLDDLVQKICICSYRQRAPRQNATCCGILPQYQQSALLSHSGSNKEHDAKGDSMSVSFLRDSMIQSVLQLRKYSKLVSPTISLGRIYRRWSSSLLQCMTRNSSYYRGFDHSLLSVNSF